MKSTINQLFHTINQQTFANPIKATEKRWLGNLQGMSEALWLASLNEPSNEQHNRLKSRGYP